MPAEVAFSHSAYARIAALFAARTGIISAPNRAESIEAGIRRAQCAAQIADPWEYLDRLGRSAELLDGLIRELAIGETYFFRDSEQMASLRSEVLPELMSRLGPSGRRLRIWSAGCSTGEEPYSLAILLDQAGLLDRADILGTDLNPLALEQARCGVFREWSMRDVDGSIRTRYFQPVSGRLLLSERIRLAVRFELHNLLSAEPPPAPSGLTEDFDLILCRNVVIYFDLQLVKEIAERFYQYLAPGGWLLMGASDAPLWDYAPFTPVRLPGGVVYSKRPPTVPSSPSLPALPPPLPPPIAHEAHQANPAQAALLSVQSVAAQQGAEEAWKACAQAAEQHPFHADLQILSAMLLLDLGRCAEARSAARRAIYLDRASPLAHYVLGTTAQRLGDLKEALLSFRNARDCAAALPKDTPIPLFEGGRAGQLSQSARMRMTLLAGRDT